LIHLIVAAARDADRRGPRRSWRRFSALSLAAVMALAASGVGLASTTSTACAAVLGTGRAHVLTKVVILWRLTILAP